MADKTRKIEERKIQVSDVNINFVRVGTGNHVILLMPGALGTIWSNYKSQIENLDAEKLTIVAWDPPGYGKSRPPDRTFPDDFLERDAVWAHDLMKNLNFSKFSLLGWSDGGVTSLFLAAMYPESVHKMIVVGTNAYRHPNEIKLLENIRNIDKWSASMRALMLQVYNEKYFRQIWSNWTDTVLRLYKKQNGNVCKQVLPKIKCSTLIIHGAKDIIVLPEQATYLKQNIVNSSLYIFENGAHNLHLKYPKKFNKLIMDFLLEKS